MEALLWLVEQGSEVHCATFSACDPFLLKGRKAQAAAAVKNLCLSQLAGQVVQS